MILASVIGNLGRDAEVKHIGDKDYISFSVASTEKQGENETTTWVSVLAGYNNNLLPFLKKGIQVFVSGRMKACIYQSQNTFGIDISVFANTIQLCGSKREDTAHGGFVASNTPPPADPSSAMQSSVSAVSASQQTTEQDPDLPF